MYTVEKQSIVNGNPVKNDWLIIIFEVIGRNPIEWLVYSEPLSMKSFESNIFTKNYVNSSWISRNKVYLDYLLLYGQLINKSLFPRLSCVTEWPLCKLLTIDSTILKKYKKNCTNILDFIIFKY